MKIQTAALLTVGILIPAGFAISAGFASYVVHGKRQTLAEALELFKTSLPLTLGEFAGKEVVIGEGKYGPYVNYDNQFISIPRGKDPLKLTMDEAIELIAQKQLALTPIHQWGDVQVLRGKYGAYIHTPEGNYQIPKSSDAASLTEAEVREIMAKNEPLKPGKRTFKRKSAK